MEEIVESFNGKTLKKILISSKIYDEDYLTIKITEGCQSDEKSYTLNKLFKLNNVTVYGIDCDVNLHESSITCTVTSGLVYDKSLCDRLASFGLSYFSDPSTCSILYDDDGKYNHVRDMCKQALTTDDVSVNKLDESNYSSIYLPTDNQMSYSVYIGMDVSAISVFVTV